MRRVYWLLPFFVLQTPGFAATAGEEGVDHFFARHHASARNAFTYQLRQAKRTADQKSEVIQYINLSTLHHRLGHRDSCTAFLQKAKQAAGSNPHLLQLVNLNIGLLKPSLTIHCTRSDIHDLHEILTRREWACAWVGYGKWLLQKKACRDAESAFEKAEKLYRKENQSLGQAVCLYQLAVIRLHQNKPDQALELSDRALALYQQGRYTLGIKQCLTLQKAVYEKRFDKTRVDFIETRIQRLP